MDFLSDDLGKGDPKAFDGDLLLESDDVDESEASWSNLSLLAFQVVEPNDLDKTFVLLELDDFDELDDRWSDFPLWGFGEEDPNDFVDAFFELLESDDNESRDFFSCFSLRIFGRGNPNEFKESFELEPHDEESEDFLLDLIPEEPGCFAVCPILVRLFCRCWSILLSGSGNDCDDTFRSCISFSDFFSSLLSGFGDDDFDNEELDEELDEELEEELDDDSGVSLEESEIVE